MEVLVEVSHVRTIDYDPVWRVALDEGFESLPCVDPPLRLVLAALSRARAFLALPPALEFAHVPFHLALKNYCTIHRSQRIPLPLHELYGFEAKLRTSCGQLQLS